MSEKTNTNEHGEDHNRLPNVVALTEELTLPLSDFPAEKMFELAEKVAEIKFCVRKTKKLGDNMEQKLDEILSLLSESLEKRNNTSSEPQS